MAEMVIFGAKIQIFTLQNKIFLTVDLSSSVWWEDKWRKKAAVSGNADSHPGHEQCPWLKSFSTIEDWFTGLKWALESPLTCLLIFSDRFSFKEPSDEAKVVSDACLSRSLVLILASFKLSRSAGLASIFLPNIKACCVSWIWAINWCCCCCNACRFCLPLAVVLKCVCWRRLICSCSYRFRNIKGLKCGFELMRHSVWKLIQSLILGHYERSEWYLCLNFRTKKHF